MLRFLQATAALAAALMGADPLYFPPVQGEWARVDPKAAGWDAAKLDEALRFAGERRSTGVVVLHRGHILAERHWDAAKLSAGPQYRAGRAASGAVLEDVASVQKSLVSLLLGIAAEKNLLGLDDPVARHLGAGWTKAPAPAEAAITIRHLLTMTSGLSDALGFEAAAGSRWRYNSVAYQKLARVLEKAAGKPINGITREWLTGPIGMADSSWRARHGLGDMMGFQSTARDLARFGLLVLGGGVWEQRRIVPEPYLRVALSSSQELNPAYGFLWWLNGKPVARGGPRTVPTLIAGAPRDLVAALGALGRKVYVAPSLGLVVTRIGQAPEPAADFDEEFWKLLTAARLR